MRLRVRRFRRDHWMWRQWHAPARLNPFVGRRHSAAACGPLILRILLPIIGFGSAAELAIAGVEITDGIVVSCGIIICRRAQGALKALPAPALAAGVGERADRHRFDCVIRDAGDAVHAETPIDNGFVVKAEIVDRRCLAENLRDARRRHRKERGCRSRK